jgi:hypothetical protein
MTAGTTCVSSIDIVPDETLVEIARWLPTAKDIIQLTRTCRRMKTLIDTPAVVSQVLQERHIPSSLSTWEHMAWYERMATFGLLKENRIGFQMASVDILDEDHEEDEGEDDGASATIRGNLQRVDKVRILLQAFPRLRVTVDSHCGTFGPLGIAGTFSRARGMVVVDELTRSGHSNSNTGEDADGDSVMGALVDRVTLNAWGRRISDHAAMVGGGSTHPYTTLAKQGKGWVEMYLDLDGIELPCRPDFYKGFFAVNHRVDLELYLPPSRTREMSTFFRLFQYPSSNNSSSEEEESDDGEQNEMEYDEQEAGDGGDNGEEDRRC